jgi:hypothetical protein
MSRSYLVNLDRALEQTAVEVGSHGRVDVFDLSRRLAHRMGLASPDRRCVVAEAYRRVVVGADRCTQRNGPETGL